MIRTSVILIGLGIGSIGCASDDDVVNDCYGGLGAEIPLANVPQNVAISWNGAMVVNECDGTRYVSDFYKTPGLIYVERMGFGSYVPAELNITIKDLKDCRETGETIFNATSPLLGRPTCREEYLTLTP